MKALPAPLWANRAGCLPAVLLLLVIGRAMATPSTASAPAPADLWATYGTVETMPDGSQALVI